MKNVIVIFLLSFKLVYCHNFSTSNIQNNEIERLYGTTELDENVFESVVDKFGKNETIIELSDLHPNVLWNVNDEKEGEVIVKAEEGYKIVVAIVECSIKGSDSYVKISPKNDFSTKDTLLFIYDIKEHYTYLFNSNILFVEAHVVEKVNSKFTVNFTRIGEKAVQTTTAIPTTTIILPTPASNESSEITVYLGGMEPSQFKQLKVVTTLKEILSNMATAYCKDQHFPFLENITVHNIIISRLSPCPTYWRNAEKCIELRFAIPVELNEDVPFKWTGYQLNSVHLKIMWERYSKEYLEGLWVYDPPNINSSMKWEIIFAVLVIIFFGVILVALKYILIVWPDKKRQRKLSDTTSIISSNSRHSELSLRDHYLQEVPPIFHTTYTMYDPTKVPFVDPFDISGLQNPTITDEKEEIASLSDLEESGA